MISKYSGNPILDPRDIPYPWANVKVYNAAAVYALGVYHLFFRARGTKDAISRIGHARSRDGIHFEIDPEPAIAPRERFESNGCEDPRISQVNGTYYLSYTAFDGRTARIAMTASQDLVQWGPRQLLLPQWHGGRWNKLAIRKEMMPDIAITSWDKARDTNWSKGGVIFPERFNGQYRLMFGDDSIWSASSTNLKDWKIEPEPVLQPRKGHFDQSYVEMGPPPLKTEKGWLIFYHGIAGWGNKRIYSIGAALFDLKDPTKLMWRSREPLIEPTEPFEVVGLIDIIEGGASAWKTIPLKEVLRLAAAEKLPKAVFCTGAVAVESQTPTLYRLYYAGADTVICLASLTLDDIL